MIGRRPGKLKGKGQGEDWLLKRAENVRFDVTPTSPPASIRPAKYGLGVGLLQFLAAFSLGGLALAASLRTLDLPRFEEPMEVNIELLTRHPDATVIFFGASTVMRGIDPEVVDTVMAAEGCKEKSLNLAYPAISIPEMVLMLRHAQEVLPPGTTFVLDGGIGYQQPSQWKTRNRRNSFSLEALPILAEQMDFHQASFSDALLFLRLFSARALAMHQLADLVAPTDPPSRRYLVKNSLRQRGFVPFSDPLWSGQARRHAKHLERLESIEYFTEYLITLVEAQMPMPAAGRMILKLVNLIREGGQRPVLMAMPALSAFPLQAVRTAVLLEPGLPLIDNGIDRGLFAYDDTDMFLDRTHLKPAGARIVSEVVGRSLCGILRQQQGGQISTNTQFD